MAEKYISTFFSESGAEYQIQIHESTFTGTPIEFDCLGIQIKYDVGGNDDERFNTIVSSTASVDMYINSSDLNAFVEDLVSSYENKYFVYIRTNQLGQETTYKWVGYVLTDLVSIEDVDLNLGYSFTLQAKDGLNTLKNIDYNNNGSPYTGKATIFKHINDIFLKLGSVNYAFASFTEPLWSAVINWHSEEYTYSSTNTVLTKARIPYRAFYHIDTKGNYVYKNCYEVLNEICKAFGCRVISSATGYYITQINEYLNANSVYEYNYKLLGSLSGATKDYTIEHDQSNPNTTEIYRLAGSSFEFFSPLQYARVEYEHLATRNLLAGAFWNYNDETPKTAEDVQSNNFDSILQLDLTLAYYSTFTQTVATKSFEPHYLVFRIEFKLVGSVTTHYYQNTFTRQYNKNVITNGSWDTTTGYYYFIVPKVEFENQAEQIQNIQLIIPNIPTDGDLSVKVELYNVYGEYGLDPLPNILQGGSVPVLQDYYTVTYEAANTFLQYIHTGFFSDQNDIIRFQSDNDNVAYKTYEVTTIIGDGPNLNSPGHLEVKNDSDEWVITENGWKVGNTGDAKNISQLLCNEVIKGQLLPVKKFMQTTFIMNDPDTAFLQPHYAISYDSGYWVFHGGTYDLYKDAVKGVWWKIKEDN
jgi:hypothetical protein